MHDISFTLYDMQYVVRAAGLRGFKDVVTSLGGDAGALLRSSHMPADCLDQETNLIDCKLAIQMLERAAVSLNCQDLGMRVAMHHDVSILGPLALAVRNSATVGEGFECVSKYFSVHSNAFALTVRRTAHVGHPAAELRFDLLLPDIPVARQFWEVTLASANRVFQVLTQGSTPIKAVHFPHAPLAPRATYQRIFGDRVFFEQPQAMLVVDGAALDMPLRGCDQTLKDIALHYLTANFSSTQTMSDRVRLAVHKTLETPQVRIENIAELFNLHQRTLQRQLEAEGSSFELLRDEARRDAARRYLTATQLPLAQIPGLLGLSEQSALTRACKRWFGVTPKALRMQLKK
ncbi:MAG: AraC family transcriptional regulator [Rhodoferax sp.]|nr:AraC family transcriptional regulator [Rhodoferax sp.]